MKTFLSLVGKQIQIGTSVALLGGTLLGLLIGIYVASLENVQILFLDIGSSVYAVIFLASICALFLVVVFLPIELVVSFLLRIWPSLSKYRAKLFYSTTLIVGVIFIHIYLWLGFNFVRGRTSATGILLAFSLFLTALGLTLATVRLWPKKDSAEEISPNGWVLSSSIVILIALSVFSHKSLVSSYNSKVTSNKVYASTYESHYLDTLNVISKSHLNVILISIDTLRADHLGSYGYHRQTSPYLDSLMDDGIIFLNSRSQSPWTLPSHATMLTSLYPSTHGARFWNNNRFLNIKNVGGNVLPEWYLTLAEILNEVGYNTAAFTSSAWLSSNFGLAQGFSKFEMDVERHTATIIVDKAIKWAGNQKGKPYFIFLHFNDVHEYNSVPEYDGHYQDQDYEGKLRREDLLQIKINRNMFESLSDADLEYLIAKYDSKISYVDFELGRLFKWLRTHGQYDKTLIIATSDHGEEFWDHGGTGHSFTLYDEQLRVPLIIKPPEIYRQNGKHENHTNVGLIDIMPTVLDYLGIPEPPYLEGISLRPLIETDTQTSRILFAEAATLDNIYAAVQNEFKYIGNRFPPVDFPNLGRLVGTIRSFYKFRNDELYRIDVDPKEMFNISDAEKEAAKRLRLELIKHIQAGKAGKHKQIDQETVEKLRSLGYMQ